MPTKSAPGKFQPHPLKPPTKPPPKPQNEEMPIKSEIRKREADMPTTTSEDQKQKQPDDSKHMKPRRGPADPSNPSEDPAAQQADEQAKQARQAASQQVFDKLKDKYSDVHKTDPGAMFPYEGTCLRCGWHTLELSEDAAKKMIEAHIAVHWRDAVAGIQLQGGQGLLGVEPATANLRQEAMKAQEEGAIKGGQEALKPVEEKVKQQQQKMQQLAEQFSGSSSSGSGQQGQQYGG